jgi:3-isopropylmalate/(R)-2-methylmalate dehydratase small subunit
MQIDKIVKISGCGVPVRGNDIDTDRIIPARFLKTIVFEGLGAHAFADDRIGAKAAGGLHPFDDPRFAGAAILLANKNFGCGSSREHAPQALKRWGVQAVVGVSYAEIFRSNCQAIGIPVCVVSEETAQALQDGVEAKPQSKMTVNLEKRQVSLGRKKWPLEIPDGVRQAFLEGTWDPTAELFAAKDRIEEVAATLPYFRGWKA